MAAPEKKRQSQRIRPFVAPCRYVLGEERFPGFLTDISETGGRVHTEVEPPAVGTALAVEVRLGRKATPLRLPATVRWTGPARGGSFLFGLLFVGVGPEEQTALDAVVDEFQRRAASIG